MPYRSRPAQVPYEALLQSSTDLLSVHDDHGRVLFANEASRQLLGLTPEELLLTTPFRLVHPDDRDDVIAAMVELGKHPGEVRTVSLRARHADGSYRHLECLARNHLDDPTLRGVLVSSRDVTDRTRAQETLHASEARSRQLVDRMPVGLAVVDGKGRVRFANPTAQAVAGAASPDELLGREVTGFLREDDRERCTEALRLALAERVVPGAAEYRLARSDPDGVVVSATPLPYEWEGEQAVLLMLQDVTALHRAERQRQLASERLAGILAATAEGIVGLGQDGLISFMNPAAAAALGLDADAVLGRDAHDLYHHTRPDGTPYPREQCPVLRALHEGRPMEEVVEVLWRADGAPVPVEYRATPMPSGPSPGAVLTFHDVSERLRARGELARVAAFQGAVLDALPSLTAVVDRHGVIVAVNHAWEQHALERGGSPQGVGVGVDVLAVCEATQGESRPGALAVAAGLRALLEGSLQTFEQDVPCTSPEGDVAHFSLLMVPLRVPEGGVVIGYTDITARKQLEVDAAHRATHDVLTGLPNRTLLLDRLEHAMDVRGAPSVAVLFLDLDGFKLVNDGYGHEAGDTVLRLLAQRLRQHVRPADTVARLSGDEFVVLCERLHHPTEAHVLAERLITAVAEPFPIGSTTVLLGVSIGIAVATEPLTSPDALLRAADQAMFDAKARGRNRFTVYDAGVHGRHHVRLEQAMALRRLVDGEALLVHYQPVVDLRTGELLGAEALLRWDGEPRLPDTATAIGLAEEMGLINRIGRFVLREATCQAATFLRPDGSALPLAVNLAPQQLDHGLVDLVESAAAAADYPMSSMTLELTERSLMSDPRLAVEVLHELRERGVRIALDDFGVGYSSLAALSTLPLDVLKIDAGFVRGLDDSAGQDGRIITAIVELARVLGLELVAEGVEHQEQRQRLLDLGCRTGQGWLFSRARPPDALRSMTR